MQVRRMDKYVEEAGLDETQVAQAEADAIDAIWSGLPLRLHVAGDCRTDAAAQIVSAAAARYTSRNRNKAWTYSHAWRDVARESWGGVSVLASCESADDALKARDAGYAAAIVVPEFPEGKRAWPLGNGLTAIACLEQTGASPACTSCRLCWDDEGLRRRKQVIAFAAHGSGVKKVKQALNVLNG
jgi:hypothetical protein